MKFRKAPATARNALLDLAAQHLNVAKDDLAIKEGVIAPKAGGTGVAYQDLIGGKEFMLKVDPTAPLKSPADYKLGGRPIARRDRNRVGRRTCCPGTEHNLVRVRNSPGAGKALGACPHDQDSEGRCHQQ